MDVLAVLWLWMHHPGPVGALHIPLPCREKMCPEVYSTAVNLNSDLKLERCIGDVGPEILKAFPRDQLLRD